MRTILRATLIIAAAILPCMPVLAQSTAGYDMSGMTGGLGSTANTGSYNNSTYGSSVTSITNVQNTPYQQEVIPGVGMVSDAQEIPGSYVTNNGDGTTSVTHVLGNTSNFTGTNTPALFGSSQSLLAPRSWFGNTSIPTGDSLGFPMGAPKFYKGVCGFQYGGILQPTSTAEVTLNIIGD
jgi:hypothetical protein